MLHANNVPTQHAFLFSHIGYGLANIFDTFSCDSKKQITVLEVFWIWN